MLLRLFCAGCDSGGLGGIWDRISDRLSGDVHAGQGTAL